MCIIIDANKIGDFFNDPPAKDAEPIRIWLDKKGGKLVYPTYGKFAKELKSVRSNLLEFFRKGAAIPIKYSNSIDSDEKELKNRCESNDAHILALARASGARLLYTADKDLITDFKNENIINDPKGKIYSNASHKHLLRKDMCRPQTKPTK